MAGSKLVYVCTSVKSGIKLIRHYGFYYGFFRLLLSLVPKRLREKARIFKYIDSKCNSFAKNYLKERYGHIIDEFSSDFHEEIIGKQCCIWIFWWQGIEFAPSIVRACVQSIKKNAENRPVVLLDQHNYSEYVKLPEYIMNKFEENKITITHFSDLLRVELLYHYGGIWMDATIYMQRAFDADLEKMRFFSVKFAESPDDIVKLGMWTAFLIGAGKHNFVVGLLRNLFYEYWKQEEQLIVYLLIDFFLTMIYESRDEVKQLIDEIPYNNIHILTLAGKLNMEEFFLNHLPEDTYLYKLTYKMKLNDKIDGKKTVYGKLCEGIE